MQRLIQIETLDRQLLAGIADTLAEAGRRGGDWVVCRPGCTQCCIGPFPITQLDALRLRQGLATLESADPGRAERVRTRSAAYVATTGGGRNADNLPPSMDDVPCPALDPDSGWCDLYAARPIMCRAFGPVTRTGEDTVAACELCYEGATEEQMAACAVEIDPEGLESELLAALDSAGLSGATIVAYALAVGDIHAR